MKYTPVNPEKLRANNYGKYRDMVLKFAESDDSVWKIEWDDSECSNYKGVQSCFYNAVKQQKLTDKIRVSVIEGELYLIKK